MDFSSISSGKLRTIFKDFGLGKLVYRLYFSPKSQIERANRWGVVNSVLTERGRSRMEKSVSSLPRLEQIYKDVDALDVYFMTGRKYWYQTCYCAYSMQRHTDMPIRPIIFDDGSLQLNHSREIYRIFPDAKIISLESVEKRLEQFLPKGKFPTIRERRIHQPLLRKLTDFHAGLTGWKLFLDSDMLFFREPKILLNWLMSPQEPCYMVDVMNAYGYSPALMESLSESEIPDLVNIGILGLKSDEIDWEKIEFWLKTLLDEEGTHYNVTQCLSAMYLSGKSSSILPAETYAVLPNKEEVLQPKAVLHHYVADSKPLYFRYGWKHILDEGLKIRSIS